MAILDAEIEELHMQGYLFSNVHSQYINIFEAYFISCFHGNLEKPYMKPYFWKVVTYLCKRKLFLLDMEYKHNSKMVPLPFFPWCYQDDSGHYTEKWAAPIQNVHKYIFRIEKVLKVRVLEDKKDTISQLFLTSYLLLNTVKSLGTNYKWSVNEWCNMSIIGSS